MSKGTWKNGTRFPDEKRYGLTDEFFRTKDFFSKLKELKKIFKKKDELLEWISFPMSNEERQATGLTKRQNKSLITYNRIENHEINQTIPHELNCWDQIEENLKEGLYIVSDEKPICALKTNRKKIIDNNGKHSQMVYRALLHLRNCLKDKMSVQFLRLPSTIRKIENIDTEQELREYLLQESVMITDKENSASLWMKSRDQKYLALKMIYQNDKIIEIDGENDNRIPINPDQRTWFDQLLQSKKSSVRLGNPEDSEAIIEKIDARITLGIPLIFQNSSIGILCIYSKKYYHFLPTDIMAADTLATATVPCLEAFTRINTLNEIEQITGRVLNARTNIGSWLEYINQKAHIEKALTWSVHLKDPETGMIDAIVEYGAKDKKWKRESRHHCTTDDIHAQIIRNNEIQIIQGIDKRFDPAISRRYDGRERMTSIVMPLYQESISDDYLLCDETPKTKETLIKKYKLTEADSEAIGSLQITTKDNSSFSEEEFKLMFRIVQENIDTFNQFTLRKALSLLPDSLCFFGKAQEAILCFGPVIYKDKGLTLRFKFGKPGKNFIQKTFQLPSNDNIASIQLKFDPDNEPSKMEMLFIERFMQILGRLLEAVYDRRISSNKGRFLQELSIAITEFHNSRKEGSFIEQIAKIMIRYFYAEDVCFIKGHDNDSENGGDKKMVMYRIGKDENPKQCVINSCFLADKDWIEDGSYYFKTLSTQFIADLPSHCHFVKNASQDDRFIFKEIVKASPNIDKKYFRMLVRLKATSEKIKIQVDELLDLLNISVGSVLKGHWKHELEKNKWMKRFTDMSNLSTDSIDELINRTIDLLKGTNGYVGVTFFGYDDHEDMYFVYRMDGEENYFEPGQKPTHNKFKRIKVKGEDFYKDKNVNARWIEKTSLDQPPFSYFPFKRDMDLLIVIPKQHGKIEGSIFNHFVVVRKTGEDDKDEARFLTGLALVLRDQIRRIETKKMIKDRSKAEDLFKVYIENREKLFSNLFNLIDKVAGPCMIAQYEGMSHNEDLLKLSKQSQKLADKKFEERLHKNFYQNLIIKDFLRLETKDIFYLLRYNSKNISSLQGWIFRLSSETGTNVRFLIGVHLVDNQETGLFPFDFNRIEQIVDVYDPLLWHVEKVKEVTVQAAQVAHSVKSHFGGIIDHADLAAMRLKDFNNFVTSSEGCEKVLEIISRIHKTLDSAKFSIGEMLNKQGLPDRIINIDSFVNDIIIRFQRDAIYRLVRIESKFLNNLPHISVRGPAFDIIISNLIDNAIKYSWEDHYVLIKGQKAPKSSDYEWLIIVQNYGEGIPIDENEEIYEFHERGKARERRSPSDGMGIGLPTSRQLAREMGMDIDHISQYKGSKDEEKKNAQRFLTTFRVWIPKNRIAK